jgi:hypothetical protein
LSKTRWKTTWLRRGCGVAASVAALVCTAGPASAYSPPAGPAFSLTVSPTRLVVDPQHVGDVQTFQVSNGGRTPFDIEVQKRNFTANVDGTLEFQANAPYSASAWVDAEPSSFRLPPHSVMNVKVRITMPANPEPGDHQVALVFIVPSVATQSNIRINRGIGTPIYIRVPGTSIDSVQLDGLQAPRFSLSGPISFTTMVRDTGTVHRDFRGVDQLGVRVDGHNVPFPEFTVLRGTDRRITTQWRNPPLICFCKATVSITDADGVVHRVTASVTIFPVHLVAILLVVVAVLILVIRQARRRYRRQVLAAADAIRGTERPASRADEGLHSPR